MGRNGSERHSPTAPLRLSTPLSSQTSVAKKQKSVAISAPSRLSDKRLYPGEEEGLIHASRWYFVGPPPAFSGRRPRAEPAASPQGWPPAKTSLSPFRMVFDCKWYKRLQVRKCTLTKTRVHGQGCICLWKGGVIIAGGSWYACPLDNVGDEPCLWLD
jgi:hypothetical protein